MKEAVILLCHGSIREQANVETRAMWKRFKEQLPNLPLSGAFVEAAEPTLEQEVSARVAEGYDKIIVVPMFLSRGNHISNGIPRAVSRLQGSYEGVEIEVTKHLGADPLIAEIIKNLIREAGVDIDGKG